MSKLIEAAIDKFTEEGPFTFEAAFLLAEKCAKSDEWQIGDSLNEISHKFPPSEFRKLLNPATYLSPEQLALWYRGTELWKLSRLNAGHTDEHLKLIAKKPSVFALCLENAEPRQVSEETRFLVLRDVRQTNQRPSVKRDASPMRKPSTFACPGKERGVF